jgi:hypothetical protein
MAKVYLQFSSIRIKPSDTHSRRTAQPSSYRSDTNATSSYIVKFNFDMISSYDWTIMCGTHVIMGFSTIPTNSPANNHYIERETAASSLQAPDRIMQDPRDSRDARGTYSRFDSMPDKPVYTLEEFYSRTTPTIHNVGRRRIIATSIKATGEC